MKRIAVLTPELSCSDLKTSLRFYLDILGFHIYYERPETGFAMLERQGARIMLEQSEPGDKWCTGPLERPFGRGVNFQIQTDNVDILYKEITSKDVKIFIPLEEKWYRANDKYVGNKQFLIQDPDGYLLRFFEDMGERSVLPQ